MLLTKARPIEITDKAIFNEYLARYPPNISELTFTNLFIWRNHYKYLFSEWEDHLLIFSIDHLKTYGNPLSGNQDAFFFLPPIGPNPTNMMLDLLELLKTIEIHRVPQVLVDDLIENRRYASLKIKYQEDRNNWDYVYEREKLVSLAGRKLYNKRRWLKRFSEKYPENEFHLLSEEWLTKCRELQIEWCNMNECRHSEDLMEEQKAITAAFDFYSNLKYRGGLLLLNGKCIAYTLGEKLNTHTAVIHIEKALIDYEGSYQAINNLFAKNCCEDVIYINREQDLGDPGLRQAKESYVPHHLVKKYIIYI